MTCAEEVDGAAASKPSTNQSLKESPAWAAGAAK
jgi:hypothetical protein